MNEERTIRDVILELKQGVKDCKKDKTMSTASWGYEEGILITGDDAVLILKALNIYIP